MTRNKAETSLDLNSSKSAIASNMDYLTGDTEWLNNDLVLSTAPSPSATHNNRTRRGNTTVCNMKYYLDRVNRVPVNIIISEVIARDRAY